MEILMYLALIVGPIVLIMAIVPILAIYLGKREQQANRVAAEHQTTRAS